MNYAEKNAELARLKAMPSRTKEELVAKLKALAHAEEHVTQDTDREHVIADEALLEFIGDPEVTEAFNSIHKWYA